MEWIKFEELDKEYPETVVENKIAGFENATSNFASLGVFQMKNTEFITSNVEGDFKFKLYLFSKAMKNYKFEVFTFGYGIKLSPINFIVEGSIEEELFGKSRSFQKIRFVNSTKELEKLLDSIFNSVSFNTTVRGLIKVAKKQNDL